MWDEEYRRGRYRREPPVGFVNDILEAVVSTDTAPTGLYIGCGNGRNYLPLADAGLDLVGWTSLKRRSASFETKGREPRVHSFAGTSIRYLTTLGIPSS